MKVTDRLYQKVQPIWQGYNRHPFVKGIADGTLSHDRFKFYMVQDYVYLLDYAKVFALGVVKSKAEKHMKIFSNLIHETINAETDTHKKYAKRLDLDLVNLEKSPASLTTQSYTKYMLSVAFNEGVAEIAVAVLACSWSYKCIGDFMRENAVDTEFFRDWIATYSDGEYVVCNDELIDLVDELTANYSEAQIVHLEEILINCSRYEDMFWDMSWNKEM